MNPYRTHSPIDDRRVRRLVRKQARLDKRILQRAEERFQIKERSNLVFLLVMLGYNILLVFWLYRFSSL